MTNITKTIVTGVKLTQEEVNTLVNARKLIDDIALAYDDSDNPASSDWTSCRTAVEIIDDILNNNLSHLWVLMEEE